MWKENFKNNVYSLAIVRDLKTLDFYHSCERF